MCLYILSADYRGFTANFMAIDITKICLYSFKKYGQVKNSMKITNIKFESKKLLFSVWDCFNKIDCFVPFKLICETYL